MESVGFLWSGCGVKKPMFELKGEMSLLNVLLIHTTNMDSLGAAIEEKGESSWKMLERSPVIVDFQQISDDADINNTDFGQLKSLLSETGLIPVGLRNLNEAAEAAASAAGWAVLRAGRSQTRTPPVRNKPATEPVQRLVTIDRPVRSGQQVYCADGDIVVLQQTSAGSELLAAGSVHVYGALRGRVLAGVQGDTEARIFCQKLEAELVAIAGRYRLLDDMEENLKGQAVMVFLEGEKLKIVAI